VPHDGSEVRAIGHWLDPVRSALDAAPRPIDLFFRDDDVGWDDPGLWALLDLFEARSLPLDLGVIPLSLRGELARELRARAGSSTSGLAFHQHGLAHTNHEPTGRNYEFGPSRSRPVQRQDIAEGRSRLQDHLGALVEPIFTPPWNRCTLATAECLVELGFEVLSREARASAIDVPGLVELPVRVDWFAHHKRVRLRRVELGELLAKEIAASGPIGIMFHHAVMDDDERSAASELITLIAEHDRAETQRMLTLAARQGRSVAPAQ
jgi:hypothetical protein